MAIRNAPKNDSARAGAQGEEQARRDLISLSLAPVRQGLSFYAEINRSILDTVFRFIPLGMNPFAAVSGRKGSPSAVAVEPVATAAEIRTPKRPAEPAVKRSTATKTKRPATKAAASKRPATTKTAATKPPATTKTAAKRPTTTKTAATKQPAATKTAATKRPATKTAVAKRPATKRPATTKATATERPAAPPTPRRAAGQSAAQKRAGKAASKPAVKRAGRVEPSAAKKVASSRTRGARASAGKEA